MGTYPYPGTQKRSADASADADTIQPQKKQRLNRSSPQLEQIPSKSMPHLHLCPLHNSSDPSLLGVPTSKDTGRPPCPSEEDVVNSNDELIGIFDEDDEGRISEESEDEGGQQTAVVSRQDALMNTKFTPYAGPPMDKSGCGTQDDMSSCAY